MKERNEENKDLNPDEVDTTADNGGKSQNVSNSIPIAASENVVAEHIAAAEHIPAAEHIAAVEHIPAAENIEYESIESLDDLDYQGSNLVGAELAPEECRGL